MYTEITSIPAFPTTSRVWVYQADTALNEAEKEKATEMAEAFSRSWASHGQGLKATSSVLHNRFLFLMVDESMAGASGCSIDSSVAFVKQLGSTLGKNFFDRMQFSFKDGNEVKTVDRETFSALYAEGSISDDTIVFDTMISNKEDFDGGFEKKLSESWHKRMV